MTDLIRTESIWDAERKLLITTIRGDVAVADVERWENSLRKTLDEIPDNSTFKALVNLHGFQAINIDAHKKFRTIIPEILAQYNWKVGYVDLFEEEAKLLKISSTRGIRCVAAAHVHQDETKIKKYEERFSRVEEHFFTNLDEAQRWIEEVAVE